MTFEMKLIRRALFPALCICSCATKRDSGTLENMQGNSPAQISQSKLVAEADLKEVLSLVSTLHTLYQSIRADDEASNSTLDRIQLDLDNIDTQLYRIDANSDKDQTTSKPYGFTLPAETSISDLCRDLSLHYALLQGAESQFHLADIEPIKKRLKAIVDGGGICQDRYKNQ